MLSLHARPGSDGFLLGDRFASDGSLTMLSLQDTAWRGHERWGQFETICSYNAQLMMPILVLYDTLGLPAPAWQQRLTLLGATRYLMFCDVWLLRVPEITQELVLLLAPLGLASSINVELSPHICNIAVQSHLSITTFILFDVLLLWVPEITHGQVLLLAPSEITPRIRIYWSESNTNMEACK